MTRRHAVLRSAALTLFVFGLLVWLYVVIIQVTHPEWVTQPFSHVDFPPFNWRVDEAGMTAFGVSAAGFFAWQLDKK